MALATAPRPPVAAGAVPIFLDGFTHMISDAIHPIYGFRDSNAWLAALTHNAFAPTFYAGDALGAVAYRRQPADDQGQPGEAQKP